MWRRRRRQQPRESPTRAQRRRQCGKATPWPPQWRQTRCPLAPSRARQSHAYRAAPPWTGRTAHRPRMSAHALPRPQGSSQTLHTGPPVPRCGEGPGRSARGSQAAATVRGRRASMRRAALRAPFANRPRRQAAARAWWVQLCVPRARLSDPRCRRHAQPWHGQGCPSPCRTWVPRLRRAAASEGGRWHPRHPRHPHRSRSPNQLPMRPRASSHAPAPTSCVASESRRQLQRQRLAAPR